MTPSIPLLPTLLAGRTALVTGAGQGNGRTIAEGLARAGATVVVTDMNEQNAMSVAEGIRSAGGNASAYRLDVTSSDECRALAAVTADQVGRIDILINNAGIIIRENTGSERAEANWKRTIDVNVHGTFNATMAWLQDIKQASGSIVNIASIASFVGQAASLGYSPSKGAIKMLTQSLASELASSGVRVNALAPGVIETPMTAATRDDPKRLETFMARIPMERVGQPEDLVGPVLFLVSDLSRYVTGVTLPVDGGFLAV